MTEFPIVRKNPRDVLSWFLGGGVVLLTAAMGFLTWQVTTLQDELKQRPTAAQFQKLTKQLEDDGRTIDRQQARIGQLTDTLLRNKIPVPAEPKPSPAPTLPGVTPSPRPRPSPDPSPGRAHHPRPRPTPKPSASPTCTVVLAGTCVPTPPPTPTLPPFTG